jgi:ferredoxin-NADP reductase
MHKSKILFTQFVTHDVKRFILERPDSYKIESGFATEIAIDKPGLEEEKRPFTFTSLNDDKILEFTIKRYDDHDGVTRKLHSLEPGEGVSIDDPFETINYQGRGVFIAGGAGITPFIAMLRNLRKTVGIEGNTLIFSNKTQKDIIIEKELRDMFRDNPENLILTLTDENNPKYENRRVDKDFLMDKINDFSQNFYICGPPQMGKDINKVLTEVGAKAENISFE